MVQTSIFDVFHWIWIHHENVEELKKKLNSDTKSLNGRFRGQTPLSYAVSKGQAATVRILVESGALLDDKSKDHLGRIETPLLAAMRLNHEEIFKILMSYDADIDVKDFYGHDALWMAVKYERLHFVTDLLAAGAKILRNYQNCPFNLLITQLRSKIRRAIAIELILAGAKIDDKKRKNEFLNSVIESKDLQLMTLWFLVEPYDYCTDNKSKTTIKNLLRDVSKTKLSQKEQESRYSTKNEYNLTNLSPLEVDKRDEPQFQHKDSFLYLHPQVHIQQELLCIINNRGRIPPSLSIICRSRIRNIIAEKLNKDIRIAIQELPLPYSIIQYLLLEPFSSFKNLQ